jgi:hypothetical protein
MAALIDDNAPYLRLFTARRDETQALRNETQA